MPKYRSRATRCSDASSKIENAASMLESLADTAEKLAEEVEDWNGKHSEKPFVVDTDVHEQLQKDLDSAEEDKSAGLEEFSELADEMRSWEENTAEKFSQTQKYETVSETADTVENARDEVEGVDWPEVPSATAAASEWTDFATACSDAAGVLNNAASDASNCEFPGMRG